MLARSRQDPSVTRDPRYLVNTGVVEGCPTCGSTNVIAIGKPGTGIGAFGSIGFVLGAALVDAAIQSAQPMVYQCNYCNSQFTA
jgi:hypothetical protein